MNIICNQPPPEPHTHSYTLLQGLELDLDFPPMDMLLWQVFGKSDFFASRILNRKILWIVYYYWKLCTMMAIVRIVFQAIKRSIYLSIYSFRLRINNHFCFCLWTTPTWARADSDRAAKLGIWGLRFCSVVPKVTSVLYNYKNNLFLGQAN